MNRILAPRSSVLVLFLVYFVLLTPLAAAHPTTATTVRDAAQQSADRL